MTFIKVIKGITDNYSSVCSVMSHSLENSSAIGLSNVAVPMGSGHYHSFYII